MLFQILRWTLLSKPPLRTTFLAFRSQYLFLPLTVFLWREACLFPEKGSETGRIRKIKFFGNFQHCLVGAVQQRHAAAGDGLEYQFLNSVTAYCLGNAGQVFGRQAQFVCIEFHTALGGIIPVDELDEPEKDFRLSDIGCLSGKVFPLENGTQTVGQRKKQEFPLVDRKEIIVGRGVRTYQSHIGDYVFFVAGLPDTRQVGRHTAVEMDGIDQVPQNIFDGLNLVDEDADFHIFRLAGDTEGGIFGDKDRFSCCSRVGSRSQGKPELTLCAYDESDAEIPETLPETFGKIPDRSA